MKVTRTIQISLSALNRNKMRSFLTALGIIIGVGAVITMVSIGQGAKKAVEERFESMGTNLIFVHSHSRSVRGRSGAGTYVNLTEADAKAIAEKCDAVKYVSPNVSGRAQTIYGNKNWNTSIQGVGAMYPVIRNWEMEEGIFFDENHVKTGAKVCVLAPEVKKNLFIEENPIGKIIRINKIPFKIIGILKAKGQSGGWFNRDDMILMPFKTAQKRLFGLDHINSIDISAVSSILAQEAARQVEELLLIRHKIAPDAEHDFHIGDMTEIAEGAAESTQIMTNLLGGIALVSLIVGGIGIMNIMLVSVTERIREIGIRMSVGAKEKDILLQFLTEAIVLSILGGTLGVGIGIIASKLTSQISGWDTLISPISIVLAFLFSATVGIFFGFYPAHKASKLDPIEALRYE
ncbi:MAG: ABC transporter permease [bacterium]|nr:MAG: ABC transporter permease [bacterium]